MLCLYVGGSYLPASRQLRPQELDVPQLIEGIKGFRGVALADTTPINYCAVDLFWDDQGLLRDRGGRLPPAAARHREQCGATAKLAEFASITKVTAYPDSVVLLGATRNLMGGRVETYVFNRRGTAVAFHEYRVTGIYNYR